MYVNLSCICLVQDIYDVHVRGSSMVMMKFGRKPRNLWGRGFIFNRLLHVNVREQNCACRSGLTVIIQCALRDVSFFVLQTYGNLSCFLGNLVLRKEYHQHLRIVARNRSSYQISFTYTIPTCFTGTRIPVYLWIYICMYTYVCIVAWDRFSKCFGYVGRRERVWDIIIYHIGREKTTRHNFRCIRLFFTIKIIILIIIIIYGFICLKRFITNKCFLSV